MLQCCLKWSEHRQWRTADCSCIYPFIRRPKSLCPRKAPHVERKQLVKVCFLALDVPALHMEVSVDLDILLLAIKAKVELTKVCW